MVSAAVSRPRVRLATTADRSELAALRRRVFVEEQAVPAGLERDELDDVAIHAVALDEAGLLVGTGRVVVGPAGRPGEGNLARIGRMAVAAEARGAGVGAALLGLLEAAAARAGCARAELHAQIQAEGFYRRAGYQPEGGPFDEAGIAHVIMVKSLRGPEVRRRE